MGVLLRVLGSLERSLKGSAKGSLRNFGEFLEGSYNGSVEVQRNQACRRRCSLKRVREGSPRSWLQIGLQCNSWSKAIAEHLRCGLLLLRICGRFLSRLSPGQTASLWRPSLTAQATTPVSKTQRPTSAPSSEARDKAAVPLYCRGPHN